MMEGQALTAFIREFILNERRVAADFKKQTGLNRTCIELLTYAYATQYFTIYQAQKHFVNNNVQTIRRTIKILLNQRHIERIGFNGSSGAGIYTINNAGRQTYLRLVDLWLIRLNTNMQG